MFGTSKMHLSSLVALVAGGGSIDVDSLFIFLLPLFVGVQCFVLVLIFSTQCTSSFAIILITIDWEERAGYFTLIVFLMSFDYGSSSRWLFLTVPWVGLQCVILVYPDHTHLLLSES